MRDYPAWHGFVQMRLMLINDRLKTFSNHFVEQAGEGRASCSSGKNALKTRDLQLYRAFDRAEALSRTGTAEWSRPLPTPLFRVLECLTLGRSNALLRFSAQL